MNIPKRPGIEIRPPDRARKNERVLSRESDSQEIIPPLVSLRKPGPRKQMEFTLYTNVGKCKHSCEIMDILKAKSLKFEHLDVSKMSAIPPWLKGTPIIIHDGKGYCGDSAFKFIECLSDSMVQEAEEKQKEVVPNIKSSDENVGCGIAQAFAPPKDVVDDEKYTASTDDLMKRVMAGRR